MAQDYHFDKDPTPIFVGFQEVDHDLQGAAAELSQPEFDPGVFPFYKIYKDAAHYRIDLHCASYKQHELDVQVDDDGVMSITGNRVPFAGMDTVFDGISQPDSFKRNFRLADNLTIDTVGYADGCLSVLMKIQFLDRKGDYSADFKEGDTPVVEAPPAPDAPVAPPAPVAVDPEPVVEPAPVPAPAPAPEPDPVAPAAPVTDPQPPAVAPTEAPVDPAPVAPPADVVPAADVVAPDAPAPAVDVPAEAPVANTQ